MRLSACITTRNRPQQLDECLKYLWNSSQKPHLVIVSDDSASSDMQLQNMQIVQKYPGTSYILGPQIGVCANRNSALNGIPSGETDLVAFIDDDICVEANFIALAIGHYQKMPITDISKTIISGISRTPNGYIMSPGKLNFRGYFSDADVPETVAIHAAIFPSAFLEEEKWDENIFFGYEDAELCLRALRRGYKILKCPEIQVLHLAYDNQSSLHIPDVGNMSNYEISVEAARLYVGIKRYKDLFPNSFKLVAFLVVYFLHMGAYLFKRGALSVLPEIVRRSHIQRLWQPMNISQDLA
jgi:GT2 family glycosyltransferase